MERIQESMIENIRLNIQISVREHTVTYYLRSQPIQRHVAR
jgi:hypothetical protein